MDTLGSWRWSWSLPETMLGGMAGTEVMDRNTDCLGTAGLDETERGLQMNAKLTKRIVTLLVFALLLGTVITASAAASVKLTIWDWHNPRVNMLRDAIEKYQEIRPDVEFEFLVTPWGEYWNRLLAGAAAGRVPDIAYFHNEHHGRFQPVLEPFPHDLFPLDELREQFFGFDAGFVHDGNIYYNPTGIMTSLIFYNKDIFAEAGVDPADIPDNWADFREFAKDMTVYNDRGDIEVAGFAINGYANLLFVDMNYQLGNKLFLPDGTGVDWDNDAGLQVVQTIADMYFVDQSNAPGFLDWTEAFGTGRAAMTYGWTWFRGMMDNSFPEINYGVVPLPSWTGDREPAISRNNIESGFAVMKGAPEDRKREAFEFIKWYMSEENDDLHVRMNTVMSTLPADMSLWDHPEILADPVISVLSTQAPYTIFPGEFPERVVNALVRLEEMIRNGMDPAQSLTTAQNDANRALREQPIDWVVEDYWDF